MEEKDLLSIDDIRDNLECATNSDRFELFYDGEQRTFKEKAPNSVQSFMTTLKWLNEGYHDHVNLDEEKFKVLSDRSKDGDPTIGNRRIETRCSNYRKMEMLVDCFEKMNLASEEKEKFKFRFVFELLSQVRDELKNSFDCRLNSKKGSLTIFIPEIDNDCAKYLLRSEIANSGDSQANEKYRLYLHFNPQKKKTVFCEKALEKLNGDGDIKCYGRTDYGFSALEDGIPADSEKLKDLLVEKIKEFDGKIQECLKDVERNFKSTLESSIPREKTQGFIEKQIAIHFNSEKKSFKQIIFTGAPGTGKTYSVKQFLKNKECKFVQFHPSYDYSDFVEGLRPVKLGNDKDPTFVRMDGAFKTFCRGVVERNLEKLGELKKGSSPNLSLYKEVLKNKNGDYDEYLEWEEDNRFYFFIDEINRADLSKVFGELMYCLDESYRGPENAIQTQYANLMTYRLNEHDKTIVPIENDCFAEGFFIPNNVYIIGTMNDIDKSVDSFDFALRRRFKWIDVKANEVMQESFRDMYEEDDDYDDTCVDDIIQRIKNMNVVISSDGEKCGGQFGLNESYHIGHAYFKGLDLGNVPNSLKEIFNKSIAPTLKEYTRGRNAEKVKNFIDNCRSKLVFDDGKI